MDLFETLAQGVELYLLYKSIIAFPHEELELKVMLSKFFIYALTKVG